MRRMIAIIAFIAGIATANEDTPFQRVLDDIKGDYAKKVKAASDMYDTRYKAQIEPIIKRITLSRDAAIAEATKDAKTRFMAAAANCRKLGDEVSAAVYEKEAEQLKIPVVDTNAKRHPVVGTWKIPSIKNSARKWVFKDDGTVVGPNERGIWGPAIAIKWEGNVDCLIMSDDNRGKISFGRAKFASATKLRE